MCSNRALRAARGVATGGITQRFQGGSPGSERLRSREQRADGAVAHEELPIELRDVLRSGGEREDPIAVAHDEGTGAFRPRDPTIEARQKTRAERGQEP